MATGNSAGAAALFMDTWGWGTIANPEEIDAIKRGKGGNVIRIFNGRFIRKISDLCFGLREAGKCL